MRLVNAIEVGPIRPSFEPLEEIDDSRTDKWCDPIGDDRRARLDASIEQWGQLSEAARQQRLQQHRGPFASVDHPDLTLTGADVFYLAALTLAGPAGDVASAAKLLREEHGGVDKYHIYAEEELPFSALHLEGADLTGAYLQQAVLVGAHLETASLSGAHLREALLFQTRLDGADLSQSHLQGAHLRGAHLDGANLNGADLKGGKLEHAHLQGADLSLAYLEGADLSRAYLQNAVLELAYLWDADFSMADLRGATLNSAAAQGIHLDDAQLEGASLYNIILYRATLRRARLEGADLRYAGLAGCDLREAVFNAETNLLGADLVATRLSPRERKEGPYLADVRWGGTSLIGLDWDEVRTLADEGQLRRPLSATGRPQEGEVLLEESVSSVRRGRTWVVQKQPTFRDRAAECRAAARAYRLLSAELRSQGNSTPATRFHFRAEVMARKALFYAAPVRLGRMYKLSFRLRSLPTAANLYGRWSVSWLLGTFAGYGDYVGRLFLTYAVVVCGFALGMFVAAQPTISVDSVRDVLVLSVTSFHGRGVQPPGLHLTDGLATLSGAEAIFGLLIEGLFIAAFTRRVTGN